MFMETSCEGVQQEFTKGTDKKLFAGAFNVRASADSLRTPTTAKPVIENPIGDLKELCDFVRSPYDKRFEEEGHAHSKRYKCVISFNGKSFDSEWMTNQKEAEKTAALRLLYTLPIRKVDDSCVTQRGSSHEMHFKVVVEVPDSSGEMIEFASDWMKKKLEARRDVLQKIIKHYLGEPSLPIVTAPVGGAGVAAGMGTGGVGMGVASNLVPRAAATRITSGYTSGEHYLYSSDDTMAKVKEYISRWQMKNLDKIKSIIGIENYINANLESLVTVAFIHPSFTHSEELKDSVKRILGLKWASYERLEFYGDAVLGFVASKILFEESDTDGPHELTIKRQKMVREDACCSCMKKLSLDRFVIHRDILQSPSAKVLCDVYEAIIGALYYALNEDAYPIIVRLIKLNRDG